MGSPFEVDSLHDVIILSNSFHSSPEIEDLVVVLLTELEDAELEWNPFVSW